MKATFFATQAEFRKWLSKNHKKETELIVGYYKVDSGKPSMTWSQSVDQALCFGWIDGIRRSIDKDSYCIRFTPRRSTSIWSDINIKKVKELTKAGLMMPEGLKAVETAKANGSWGKAYDSPSKMTIPEDFLKELSKNKKAAAFFATLNKSNLFSIGFQLQTAKKQETREKRMKKIIEMLAKGLKLN